MFPKPNIVETSGSIISDNNYAWYATTFSESLAPRRTQTPHQRRPKDAHIGGRYGLSSHILAASTMEIPSGSQCSPSCSRGRNMRQSHRDGPATTVRSRRPGGRCSLPCGQALYNVAELPVPYMRIQQQHNSVSAARHRRPDRLR